MEEGMFNVEQQIRRHPWAMLAAAVGVGAVAGSLVSSARRGDAQRGWTRASEWTGGREGSGFGAVQRQTKGQLGDEFSQIKGALIGLGIGLVRDFLKDAVPPKLRSKVTEVADSATEKLGGTPIEGDVMGEEERRQGRNEMHH
jgi:hypothetical protein